jgi:hypothetical protein
MKYINVENNIVTGIAILGDSGASTVSDYVVDDSVTVELGWICTVKDGVPSFKAPVPVPPTIPVMQFMMCFYPQEQAYIQNSTDPIVKVFWTRFQDIRVTEVNLALDSMSQTLDYLSATNVMPALTPPAPYLAAGRKEAILTGQAI